MGYVNVPFILTIFKNHKDVEPSDERKEELTNALPKETQLEGEVIEIKAKDLRYDDQFLIE